jgi:serine/threonine protein kinase
VNGYLVYIDEVLGIGQYGKVCKAQLATDVKSKINKVYACKIMEVAGISQEDMDCISKEVRIQNMVKSEQCVRLHQTIKTSSNIYMIQDYCNGFDLSVLLKLRKRLSQFEISLVLR